MKQFRVDVQFFTPLLGTVPTNKDVYTQFILAKLEVENGTGHDELATVPDIEGEMKAVENGVTGFHRDGSGNNCLYDYQVRGFFKEAVAHLRRDPKTQSAKLKAYKKVIDGGVFVNPRLIPVKLAGRPYVLERPSRRSGPMGDQTFLTSSYALPEGSSLSFDVTILHTVTAEMLHEWLNFGQYVGMGQWRGSGGFGRFTYELTSLD